MKHIVLSLFFLSGLVGCKKDKNTSSTQEEKLLIGNGYSNLFTITFHKPLEISTEFGHTFSQGIDVDNDDEDDLNFVSRNDSIPGDIHQTFASIQVLNPHLQISVSEQTDSIFACSVMQNDTFKLVTYYTQNTPFVCNGNGKSELNSITKNVYPRIYSKGASLPTTGNWGADSVIYLSFFNQTLAMSNPPFQYSVLLGNWNQIHFKYIVFKMTRNNENKYGWFLISLDHHNEIQLHEYAFQK